MIMNKVSNDSLEKIASEVIGCPLCKLSRSRRNAVPGDGQLSSKIMFIGEAPGKNEDEQGKPFVGAAGMILNQALEKAGIKRAEVFITNVVKCRPPNNRLPENDERSICRQYLDRQISLIAPKIICILGSTAYSSILGGKSISKDRGKMMERNGIKYFLTIHPAAAIYNKNLRSILNNDLFKLSKEIKKMRYNNKTSLLDYI
jgi:uracil-DNA glycosylase family 4